MKKLLSTAGLAAVLLAIAACEGDTGPMGAMGDPGAPGADGADGDPGADGSDGSDGADGADGEDGSNSLISQTSLPMGDENCPAGGVQIDSGVDANDNGVLEASEVMETEYVCAPGRTELNSSELINNLNNSWFVESSAKTDDTAAAVRSIVNREGGARNVILFIGDGMGLSTVTASRIREGQLNGMPGEENTLSFGDFPFTGLSKTYNVDAQVPDSAGTMTAMVTGVKTDVGVIGVDEDIERGDCSTVAGNELVTALELAELAGMSTGVVATARITHATPAATYAKSADRNWEDISDQPADAQGTCEDIASQLINFEANLEARFPAYASVIDGIEVAMGGGRRHFLPNDPAFNSGDQTSSTEGDRTDGRNLPGEWMAMYGAEGGAYVVDEAGFDALPDSTSRVLGLFNESHMQYEEDRPNDALGEPSLTDMTEKAIAILDNNPEGYFLMVESGRIDHAHHAGSGYGALSETIEFAEAIGAATEMTNPRDTLIIVTADHGHVFTIGGYPKRGNDILGLTVPVGSDDPSIASDGLPYTTLSYSNGLGFGNYGDDATNYDIAYTGAPTPGRVDLAGIDTTSAGFHQEALVPLTSETHSGEDVGVYASGPGAHLVTGTNEQNMIFHIMNRSGALVERAED